MAVPLGQIVITFSIGMLLLSSCGENNETELPPTTVPIPTITTIPTELPNPTNETIPTSPTPPVALMKTETPEVLSADFGDAPDGDPAGYTGTRVIGRFPTRLDTRSSASPGAHVLKTGFETLGSDVTTEAGANDAQDPDGTPNMINADAADDGVIGITLNLANIPVQAVLELTVSLTKSAPVGPRYVNVLIDMNMDGRWSSPDTTTTEWAVRNLEVNLAPGTSDQVQSPAFNLGTRTHLPNESWMRVTLTRTPIDSDVWDGGGRWMFGEIEDYRLELPVLSNGASSVTPLPLVTLECPPLISVPKGGLIVRTSCQLINLGGSGTTKLDLTQISGGAHVLTTHPAIIHLRAGTIYNIPLIVIRGELSSEWQFMSGRQIRTHVINGSVIVGSEPVIETLHIPPSSTDQLLFHGDSMADFFSIQDRSPVDGLAFADIRRTASGTADLTEADLLLLQEHWFTIKPLKHKSTGNKYSVFLIDLSDNLPTNDPDHGFQIAITMQATDSANDDWSPQIGDFDVFELTDTWFELIYRPLLTPAWRLQKRASVAPTTVAPTGAIGFIDGTRVLLLIPTSEIPRKLSDLTFRAVTFVHKLGDPTGIKSPSMADTSPELGRPLTVFGTAAPAVG